MSRANQPQPSSGASHPNAALARASALRIPSMACTSSSQRGGSWGVHVCGAWAGFCLILGGCATATPDPIIKYVDVKVPVNRSCIPADFPKAPTYPATQDAIKAAIEPGDLIVLLAKDREERIKRSDQTEPLVENCR